MISTLLTCVAAVWLFVHLSVKRRFRSLDDGLSEAYHAAFAAPTDDPQGPQLIALAIDLMRKKHVTVLLQDLAPNERRIAVYALAVEKLPAWMVRYAMIQLRPSEKALVNQLRHIKTSQPQKRQRHFGAIRRQQQLRALGKD